MIDNPARLNAVSSSLESSDWPRRAQIGLWRGRVSIAAILTAVWMRPQAALTVLGSYVGPIRRRIGVRVLRRATTAPTFAARVVAVIVSVGQVI